MASKAFGEATFYINLLELSSLAEMRAHVDAALQEFRESRFLNELVWFIDRGTIPASMHAWEVPLLRDFATRLVKRGLLVPSVLDQFHADAKTAPGAVTSGSVSYGTAPPDVGSGTRAEE